MSLEDVQVFRSTIRQAINTPDPDKPSASIWQNAAEIHYTLADEIHNGATFFYWHRMFLSSIESKLQALNPKFYFPYWQASAEYQNGKWQESIAVALTDLSDTRNPPKRDLQSRDLISPEQWSDLVQRSIENKQGFNFFAPAPQGEFIHGVLHTAFAGKTGDMITMKSPRDPVFFLHHAHLDLVWSSAQGMNSSDLYFNILVEWARRNLPQVGALMPDGKTKSTLNSRLPGFNYKFADVLDVSNLCVRYAPRGEVATNSSVSASSNFIQTRPKTTEASSLSNTTEVQSTISNATNTTSPSSTTTRTLPSAAVAPSNLTNIAPTVTLSNDANNPTVTLSNDAKNPVTTSVSPSASNLSSANSPEASLATNSTINPITTVPGSSSNGNSTVSNQSQSTTNLPVNGTTGSGNSSPTQPSSTAAISQNIATNQTQNTTALNEQVSNDDVIPGQDEILRIAKMAIDSITVSFDDFDASKSISKADSNNCLPLPDEWIKMNHYSPSHQEEALDQCNKVKDSTKSGTAFEPAIQNFDTSEIQNAIPKDMVISSPRRQMKHSSASARHRDYLVALLVSSLLI